MQSLQSSASTGAGLNRASETSSVGTNGRFFGAYAGSQAGASEAGRRSVSRDFSVAFLLERGGSAVRHSTVRSEASESIVVDAYLP